MLAFLVALPACLQQAPSTATAVQHDKCDDCPEGPVTCDVACGPEASCNFECRDENGQSTTCGEVQDCQTCDATCGPDVACGTQCLDDRGDVTTCQTQGACQRFDVYCAFPVIEEASIRDIHEPVTPTAYMYFASYGQPKTRDYPQQIDVLSFDTRSAWASNFRGPKVVLGGSSRPQHEWSAPGTHAVQYPYTNGIACASVPTGSGVLPVLPIQSDQIFEHDDFPSPDDPVGSFEMALAYCTPDVFAGGAQTGWTDVYEAPGSGDVNWLRYRLWCYSCANSATGTCTTGVVW